MTRRPVMFGPALWLTLCLVVAACAGDVTPSPTLGGAPSPTLPAGGTPLTPASPSPDPGPTQGSTDRPATSPSGGPSSPSPTLVPPTLPPTPGPAPEGLLLERTLPYATDGDCGERARVCQQFLDVYAPAPGTADEARPWPVAVMIHGRPRYARDMAPLAEAVARAGAVVFNVDYRGVRPVGPGWPEAPEDIACAMRYARANAAEYGGDPSTLVLVGHSYGGYLGPLVALAGDEFDGECLYSADEVSALPTGFVGIAGNYVVEVEDATDERVWSRWYRGTRSEQPEAWRMGEYRTHIGANPELVVRLIHERGDPIIPPRQPRRFYRDLRQAGYDVELQVIDGNEHFALLDPAGNGRLVVPLVLELLGIAD